MKRATLATALLLPGSLSALDITLNYDFDTYFNTLSPTDEAAAKAAIQAAADELSGIITNNLSAVPQNQVTGTSGFSGVQLTNTYDFVNPSTGATTAVTDPNYNTLDANEIIIFIGARNDLGGFGNTVYAEAYTGGGSLNISTFGTNTNLVSAMANAEANGNALWSRGIDTVNYSYDSVVNFSSGSYDYDINMAPAYGSITFNNDTFTSLIYHFDHTVAVPTGKLDVYSLALHEMMHVLGYGGSETWEENANGQAWVSGGAVAALVDETQILESDGYHVLDGTLSNGVYDDQERITVGNPSPELGERDQLTDLDIAFFQDLGYTTIFDPIPEPNSALLSLLALVGLARRQR